MAFGKKTVRHEQFYIFLKQETNLTPTKERLGIQGLSKVPLVMKHCLTQQQNFICSDWYWCSV